MSHGPLAPDAWTREESRLLATARITLLRPLRTPLRVLVLATAFTLLFTLARAVQPPLYLATIFLRVEEPEVADPTVSPRAPQEIREHIASVALSRHQLEQIMRKHHWSDGWLELDREAAIADFRSEIGLEISRDYFILQRRPGDPPRSAHVAITLSGTDAEQVLGVLHDIGQAVLRSQSDERTGHLSGSGRLLRIELESARTQLSTLQSEIARLWVEDLSAGPRRKLEIRSRAAALEVQREASLQNVLALERRVSAAELGSAAEAGQLGLAFESIDESVQTVRAPITRFQLLRRAAVTFVIMLVLSTAVMGAFDDRVLGGADLAVRGVQVLGAIPAFAGDTAGAFRIPSTKPRKKKA